MNGKNADLNTADNDIQASQLAADHGNTGTAPSKSGKVSVLNRRTLGVASVLGLLFASLLAGTLFFTSADDSASPAPKVDAKTVSGNTVSAHAQIKPAEFSTANSFYHSVLDSADGSTSQKVGGALPASRNQGATETSAAQPSSTDSVRSQCSGADCVSPRRAPVDAGTGIKLKLFKLGVADSATVTRCTRSRLCTAADGEIVGGATFALYEGRTVDEANKVGEYTVGKDGFELPGLQAGKNYTLKEVAAPAGYILNPNSYTLQVGDDGRVGVQIGKKTIYPNGEFYFPNLKEPVQTIDISLNKVSDNDTALPNVKFDLYEADNPTKPVQNITTGNDGKATLTVMPGRKYRLVETATAPGYALLPQAIEFQVDANGTVTIDAGNGNVNNVTGGDRTLKVINYPEGELPFSGQSGFLVVLLSGLSLLLVGVAISLVGRKRN